MSPDVFRKVPPLSAEDACLLELYRQCGRTLDDLPYTGDFEDVYRSYSEKFNNKSKRYVIERLFRLRKAGLLPRVGMARSTPLAEHIDDIGLLEELVTKHAGSLGRRDQLPYAREFDDLVREFNDRSTGKVLSEHAIWRLVARIAK